MSVQSTTTGPECQSTVLKQHKCQSNQPQQALNVSLLYWNNTNARPINHNRSWMSVYCIETTQMPVQSTTTGPECQSNVLKQHKCQSNQPQQAPNGTPLSLSTHNTNITASSSTKQHTNSNGYYSRHKIPSSNTYALCYNTDTINLTIWKEMSHRPIKNWEGLS